MAPIAYFGSGYDATLRRSYKLSKCTVGLGVEIHYRPRYRYLVMAVLEFSVELLCVNSVIRRTSMTIRSKSTTEYSTERSRGQSTPTLLQSML